MNHISQRVSFLFRVATDESLSVSLSDLFREKIDSLTSGEYEFDWDARGGSSSNAFGFKPGTFSFPVRPREFPDNNLIGGCLVRGTYNVKDIPRSKAPLKGSPEYDQWLNSGSPDFDNKIIEVKLIAGYYFKKEEGKLDRIQDLGTYYIVFDSQENPSFYDEHNQNFSPLTSGLKSVVDDVISDPPDGSVSQAQSKQQLKAKRQQQQQMQQQQRQQIQQKLLDSKAQRQKEQRDADAAQDAEVYGSYDSFVEWAKEEQDGVFTNVDLIKLGNHLGENIGDDPKKTLIEKGLVFKPRLAFSPEDLSSELRIIASRIDSSKNPSISAVVLALNSLISKL